MKDLKALYDKQQLEFESLTLGLQRKQTELDGLTHGDLLLYLTLRILASIPPLPSISVLSGVSSS